MDDQHIAWVDTCKGLGILLVVLGHSKIPETAVYYIFSFHMQLFFFISGYLFLKSRHRDFAHFIKYRAKSLLIPYLVFSIASITLFAFFNHLSALSWEETLKALILSKRNAIPYNAPLWFLTCLFVVEIAYFLLRKYINAPLLLVLVLSVLGFLGFKTVGLPKLPWSLDSALYFMVFYGAGNLIREIDFSIGKYYKYAIALVCIAINLSLVVPDTWPHVFEIYSQHSIFSYFLALLLSFAGIATYALLSFVLRPSRILNYLGKNSLTVFALHIPLAFPLINKVMQVANIVDGSSALTGFAYAGTAILITIPIAGLVNVRSAPLNINTP